MQMTKCKKILKARLRPPFQRQLVGLGIMLILSMSVSADTEPTNNLKPAGKEINNTHTTVISSLDTISPARQEERKAAWQKMLSAIAKRENATLFADINLVFPPLSADYERAQGKRAMQALSRVIDRKWKQIQGIQTFRRTSGSEGVPGIDTYLLKILDWAKSLDSDQRKLLLSGSLRIDRIPPDIRSSIEDFASSFSRNVPFYLLDKNTRIGFSIEFVPRIAYIDPKTGRQLFINLRSISDLPDTPRPTFENSDVPAVETLEKPDPGTLDFSDGMVLSARELLEKAATAFQKHYVMDGRIAQSYYFVSGQFSQQAFESAMQTVLTVAPIQDFSPQGKKQEENANAFRETAYALFVDLRSKEWENLEEKQVDTTWLRSENLMRGVAIGIHDISEIRPRQEAAEAELDELSRKYGATEQLPLKDFLEYKKTTVEDLEIGRPGLAAEFKSAGLAANTKILLLPGMDLRTIVKNRQIESINYQLLPIPEIVNTYLMSEP